MTRAVRRLWLGVAASAVLCTASPAAAQPPDVSLVFDNGLVSIAATDVTVPDVLETWARVGGTEVIDAGLLGRSRVSLHLERVPEAEVLRRVLETAAGYVARQRSGGGGASTFGLIRVLADPAARVESVPADRRSIAASAAATRDRTAPSAVPLPDESALEPVPATDVEERAATTAADVRALENVINGRSEATRPGGVPLSGDAAPPVPADELPAGRDDARGSRQAPAVVTDPAAVPSAVPDPATPDPATPDPATPNPTAPNPTAPTPAVPPDAAQPGPATDANGRPVRRP